MKATAYFMANPEVPGTVGNYRMSNLSDDMAITAASVGVLGSSLPVLGLEASGVLAGRAANVCVTGLVAAGTPVGQKFLQELPDAIENYITPAPTKMGLGALLGWLLGGASSSPERQ